MSVRMVSPVTTFGNSGYTSTSVYSLCGFFWHDGSTGHNFCAYDLAPGADANGLIVYWPDTASATTVALGHLSAGDVNFGQKNIVKRWMFIAFVMRSTTDYVAYLKPVGQPGFTPAQRNARTNASIANTQFQAGTVTFASGDGFPGHMGHIKFWRNRALSEAQMDQESRQLRPYNWGAFSYAPLYNGLRDLSGQGNHLASDATHNYYQFDPLLPLNEQESAVNNLLLKGAQAPGPIWLPGHYV